MTSNPNSQLIRATGSKLKQQLAKYKLKYENMKIEDDKRLLFQEKEEEPQTVELVEMERNSLMNRQRNLENTTVSLTRSLQIVQETEDVGLGIMKNLGSQREQINNQVEKVFILNFNTK
jgi:hypothetical protein